MACLVTNIIIRGQSLFNSYVKIAKHKIKNNKYKFKLEIKKMKKL